MSETAEKKVILVVDDEPMNITLLAGILKEKYKVKMAKDGEKALKVAAASPPPDLVLLDVMMPGMDGYEVCRQLKASEATRDIPVVFVSGMSEQAEQQKGLDLGAIAFLQKPIDAQAVLGKVQEIID